MLALWALLVIFAAGFFFKLPVISAVARWRTRDELS